MTTPSRYPIKVYEYLTTYHNHKYVAVFRVKANLYMTESRNSNFELTSQGRPKEYYTTKELRAKYDTPNFVLAHTNPDDVGDVLRNWLDEEVYTD